MTKTPSLSIKEPCKQSWAGMSPADTGRFCNACSKVVIDFTAYSDAELMAFFSKNDTTSICGKFTNYQLQHEPVSAARPRRYSYFWSLFIFLSILFTQNAKAQIIGKVSVTVIAPIKVPQEKPATNRNVRGKIIDAVGNPIANAVIKLLPGNLQFITKADGEFSFDLPQSARYLVIEAAGYKTMRLNASERRYIKVQLTEELFKMG